MKVKKLKALKGFVQSLKDGTNLTINPGRGTGISLSRRNSDSSGTVDFTHMTGSGCLEFSKGGSDHILQVKPGWTQKLEPVSEGWELVPQSLIARIVRDDEWGLIGEPGDIGIDSRWAGLVSVRIKAPELFLIPSWNEDGICILTYSHHISVSLPDWSSDAETIRESLSEDDFWVKRWPFGETIRVQLHPDNDSNWPEAAHVFRDYWGNRTLVALSRAAYDYFAAPQLTADVAG